MRVYKILEDIVREVSYTPMQEEEKCCYFIVCNVKELTQYNEFFNFHPDTITQCNGKGASKAEIYDGYDFVWINILKKKSIRDFFHLGIYIKSKFLVFVCNEKIPLVEMIVKEITHATTFPVTIQKIVALFFENIFTMDGEMLSNMEQEIEKTEEIVISGEEFNYTTGFVHMSKRLLYLKKYYEQLIDVGEILLENENALFDEYTIKAFRIFHGRAHRLFRNVQDLREYVTQVRQAYQAQTDIKLNSIMKMFTVIAAIFLPLTIIVGWYGMNFKTMPELTWKYGYEYVIGLSLLVIGICVYYFKRNKLL
jgi:magnesium transporter